jgi:hypothetical protein
MDNEHEQMPMINEKRTTNLRRTSSVYDNDQKTKKEGQRRPRIQQRSDTVAII